MLFTYICLPIPSISEYHYTIVWSESIKSEAQFTRREMNNEWNINFLQLAFNTLIPESLPSVEAPLKLIFWYGGNPCLNIFVNVTISSNFTVEMNFQFWKQEKIINMGTGEYGQCCTCTILYFTKNCCIKTGIKDSSLDVKTLSLYHISCSAVHTYSFSFIIFNI